MDTFHKKVLVMTHLNAILVPEGDTLDYRELLENKIREGQAANDADRGLIADLEKCIFEREAYLRGLHVALSLYPGEAAYRRETPSLPRKSSLRAGSDVERAFRVLEEAQGPLTIYQILEKIEKDPTDAKVKNSLASSLNVYCKDGRYFVRTAPSTYGILGRDEVTEASEDDVQEPPAFEERPQVDGHDVIKAPFGLNNFDAFFRSSPSGTTVKEEPRDD